MAQARHDRLKRKVGDAATEPEELVEARINLETAQQKVELLTTIARSAIDAAMAELAAAPDATRLRLLYEKGAVSQSVVEQAEAQAAAARTKLKVLESILKPSKAPAPDAKAKD